MHNAATNEQSTNFGTVCLQTFFVRVCVCEWCVKIFAIETILKRKQKYPASSVFIVVFVLSPQVKLTSLSCIH